MNRQLWVAILVAGVVIVVLLALQNEEQDVVKAREGPAKSRVTAPRGPVVKKRATKEQPQEESFDETGTWEEEYTEPDTDKMSETEEYDMRDDVMEYEEAPTDTTSPSPGRVHDSAVDSVNDSSPPREKWIVIPSSRKQAEEPEDDQDEYDEEEAEETDEEVDEDEDGEVEEVSEVELEDEPDDETEEDTEQEDTEESDEEESDDEDESGSDEEDEEAEEDAGTSEGVEPVESSENDDWV
ncbi:hypothetical protein ACFL1X_04195 [Candidatus Hydrogenedentota bacterium]